MKKIRIETGSRLHFGLLDLSGDLGRVDGGVGVGLRRPRLVIEATPSAKTSANRREDLVVEAVTKLNDAYGAKGGITVEVLDDYPSHVGLGSSTQFLLAVGMAHSRLKGLSPSPRELAGILGRGGTSGVGLGVFESGGLIVDGGHSFGSGGDKQTYLPSRASRAPPAPVVARARLPADWLFDVIVPEIPKTVSGQDEIDFFTDHCPISPEETGAIARAILSLLLPGAISGCIDTFIRGINLIATLGFKRHEINHQFPNVKSTMDKLSDITQEDGGIGMSSFGPTLFVISKKERREQFEPQILHVIDDLLNEHGGWHLCTRARNRGARVSSVLQT